jgi:hypothetical protein
MKAINPPNNTNTMAPIVDDNFWLAADFEVVEVLGFPVVVVVPVGVPVVAGGVPVVVVFVVVVKLSNFVSSVSQSCSHTV